jgi:hypothetical protein
MLTTRRESESGAALRQLVVSQSMAGPLTRTSP